MAAIFNQFPASFRFSGARAQGQVTWHNNPSFTPPNAAEAFQMVVEKKGMSPVIVTGFLPGIINYNSDEEEEEEIK